MCTGVLRRLPRVLTSAYYKEDTINLSSNRSIASWNSVLREYDLPHLHVTCPEGAGTTQEIVFPHAVEVVIV